MKRAWFSRRALVIIGTLLLGVWIGVLLEDAMNLSGNPQGLFVSRLLDGRMAVTTRVQQDDASAQSTTRPKEFLGQPVVDAAITVSGGSRRESSRPAPVAL